MLQMNRTAGGLYLASTSLRSGKKDVDGRDISERSDAALRTAMPGHDVGSSDALTKLGAERFAENPIALGRDGDGTRALGAANPVAGEALPAQLGAERAGDVRPSFAPIETRPAENALLSASLEQRRHVDADAAEERDAGFRHHSAVARDLGMPAGDQGIR